MNFFLLAPLLLLTMAASSQVSDSARAVYARAREYVNENKYAEAAAAYREAGAIDTPSRGHYSPTFSGASFRLAGIYYRRIGQYQLTNECYNAAVAQLLKTDRRTIVNDILRELGEMYDETRTSSVNFKFPSGEEEETIIVYHSVDSLLKQEGNLVTVRMDGGSNDGVYELAEATVYGKHMSRFKDRSNLNLGSARIVSVSYNTSVAVVKLNNLSDSAHLLYPGDMIAVPVRFPKIRQHNVFLDVSLLNIRFVDNARQWLAHPRTLLYYSSPELENAVYGNMLNQVKEIYDTYKDAPEYKTDKRISHGRFRGLSWMEAMGQSGPGDIKAFLGFTLSYPGKYMGGTWKISETYATWLLNDCPMGAAELMDSLLVSSGEVFRQLVLTHTKEIKDNFFDRWQEQIERMANNREFSSAHRWNAVLQKVALQLEDPELQGWAWFNLGKIFEEEEKFDESIDAYQKGIPGFEKSGDTRGMSFCINNIAFIYDRRYDYRKAQEMYARVREIRLKNLMADSSVENRISYAKACSGEGGEWYNLSDYRLAIELLRSGVRVIENVHDLDARKRLALQYKWIGKSYEKMGSYDTAATYYEHEYQIQIALGDKDAQAGALDNQAYLLSKIGRYRESYQLYSKAYDLHAQAGNRNDAGFSKSNMGQVLFSLGRYDSAIAAHREAIELRRETGNLKGQAYSWKKLAALFRESGDVSKSLLAYDSALAIYRRLDEPEEHGDLLEEIGGQYTKLKDQVHAQQYYNEALQLYRKIKARTREAGLLASLGDLYYNQQQYTQADSLYAEAQKIQEVINDRNGLMYTFTNRGSVAQYQKENYKQAIDWMKKGRQLALETGSESNLAYCQNRLGALYSFIGNYDSAFACYRLALEKYRELGDREGEAEVRVNLGYYFNYRGEFEKALEEFRKTLAVGRELNNAYKIASAYSGISGYYSVQGKFDSAMNMMEEVMKIYREKENPWGIASNYFDEAAIKSNQGDFETAIRYYQLSDSLYNKLGLLRPAISIANNLGTIYYHEHNYQKALEQFEKTRIMLDRFNDDPAFQALVCSNIGEVWLDLKKLDESEKWLVKSLALGERQNNFRQLYLSHIIMGRLKTEQQEYRQAAHHFETADSLTRKGAEQISRVQLLAHWGRMLLKAGAFDSSEARLRECIRLSAQIGYRNYSWRAYADLADLQRRQNRPLEALESMRQAVRIVEEIRTNIPEGEARSIFSSDESIVSIYQQMVLLLKEQGRAEEALVYMEKAQLENNRIRMGGGNLPQEGAAKEDLAKEQDLRRQQAVVEKELTEEKSKPLARQRRERIARLEEMRSVTAEQYKDYVNQLKIKYPNLQAFKTVDPATFMAQRRRIPADVAVISYLVTEGDISVFVVMKDTVFVKDIPLNSELLRDKIKQFYTLHARSGKSVRDARGGKVSGAAPEPEANREDLAEELYDVLLGPVLPGIGDRQRVAIVPSGLLCFVPFDALARKGEDGHRIYFGEEKQLFYVNQLTSLTSGEPPAMGPMKMMAVGNADNSLPNAEVEVKRLQQAIPHTTVYVREQATRQNVLSAGGDYNVLHLATHGILDYSDPENSYLLLAADPAHGDDGRLTIRQIERMTDIDRFSLITLSACETAVIRDVAEGWPISTASAFIEMGVPAVVATLWQVDDKATSILMEKFYANLRTMDKVQALQQAQLYLKQQPGYSDPYYWAPFQLVGFWK